MTTVSVVVNNHDYEAYVADAVRSALLQDWPDVETVVVDDGSTDRSRAVIDTFAEQVLRVYTRNCGQAAAFDAGLRASSGEVVLFLDADDVLLPTAATAAVHAFERSADAVKVTWPMWEIGPDGRRTGATHPSRALPRGDLKAEVLTRGADCYLSSPTSGNAWSRRYLEQVLPAPEADFRRGADGYLITLAPLFGLVEAVEEPHSCYRLHDRNGFWRASVEERVDGALSRHDARAAALRRAAEGLGLQQTPTAGNPYTDWLRRLASAVQHVRRTLPPGEEPFVLADGGEWGERLLAGRPNVLFTERSGVYWGPPSSDGEAVAELARHAGSGARFLVLGWPAFWWLDAYPLLRSVLEVVSASEDVVVYRLSAALREAR